MTTRTRLDKARTRLTPKQTVILMVKEAHAAGTAMEYTRRSLLEGPAGTICGRIERSMTGEVRGRKAGYTEEMTERLREAQREGTFLFGLATHCWFAVIGERQTLDLRWLLWHLALISQESWREWAEGSEFEDAESPISLERVGRELRSVRDDVLALKGAVEIIETRYFGTSVLFPQDREWLNGLADDAVELLAAMDEGLRSKSTAEWTAIMGDETAAQEIVAALTEPNGRDPTQAAGATHVQKAATRKARAWIRLIQAQVYNRMGEEGVGASVLNEAMECLSKGAR